MSAELEHIVKAIRHRVSNPVEMGAPSELWDWADRLSVLDGRVKALEGALDNLYALVKGEAAWLLDEDRGGDAKLAITIEELLKESL